MKRVSSLSSTEVLEDGEGDEEEDEDKGEGERERIAISAREGGRDERCVRKGV